MPCSKLPTTGVVPLRGAFNDESLAELIAGTIEGSRRAARFTICALCALLSARCSRRVYEAFVHSIHCLRLRRECEAEIPVRATFCEDDGFEEEVCGEGGKGLWELQK